MSDKVFPKKWQKLLGAFEQDAQSLSDDELKKCIVDTSNKVSEVEDAQDNDPDLNAAKDQVKEISTPYKELIREQQAKVRYCVFLLKDRGKL